jgi:hypothetical protein
MFLLATLPSSCSREWGQSLGGVLLWQGPECSCSHTSNSQVYRSKVLLNAKHRADNFSTTSTTRTSADNHKLVMHSESHSEMNR